MTYHDSLLAAYLGGCAWGWWIILAGSRDGIERVTGTDALVVLSAWVTVAFVALALSPLAAVVDEALRLMFTFARPWHVRPRAPKASHDN